MNESVINTPVLEGKKITKVRMHVLNNRVETKTSISLRVMHCSKFMEMECILLKFSKYVFVLGQLIFQGNVHLYYGRTSTGRIGLPV